MHEIALDSLEVNAMARWIGTIFPQVSRPYAISIRFLDTEPLCSCTKSS